MRYIFLFFLLLCNLLSANTLPQSYAPQNIFDEYQKISVYKEFSKIYPNYKEDKEFKPNITTKEEFLKKHPNVFMIKITDLTKELGAIAWLMNIYANHDKDEKAKADMEVWGKTANFTPRLTPEITTKFQENAKKLVNKGNAKQVNIHKDIIKWFYDNNFNEDLLQAKRLAESYIYQQLRGKVNRTDLPPNPDNLPRSYILTEQQEWELCEIFIKKITTDSFNAYNNRYLGGQNLDFLQYNSVRKLMLFFNNTDFEKKNHYNESYTNFPTYKDILKEILENSRTKGDNSTFLFRVTKPFEKRGYTILDSSIKTEKNGQNKLISFSYTPSLFANLCKDPGAYPIDYLMKIGSNPSGTLHVLTIPNNKLADLVKSKFLVYPPYFGLTNLFIGGGEFHTRSGLANPAFRGLLDDPTGKLPHLESEIWNKERLPYGCFSAIGQHPADVPFSYLLFRPGIDAIAFEKRYFREVVIPHLKVIYDSNKKTTEYYLKELQKYLDFFSLNTPADKSLYWID